MNWKKELIEKAIEAAKFSYAPYSHYHVGAALLAESGQVFTGCNIENASYGAANCGERTAIFKAVSESITDFKAIAIVGGMEEDIGEHTFSDYAFPCGICRQVMSEFCDGDFIILVAKSTDDYKEYTLKELLPNSFS